eukprot:CAMPEP_0194196804 /NCGR_PEP_ID=MMETSP0154-20130528/76867_1 /TAXON_ID=1049557 /ORGANISM="Thalassiothrix antarctica, Strain L6-D1" /LENGTH=241 /DNA_ID=CAMNT_0038921433 /DNA_START=244 /DNA_END=969 /DNA_ORIENTATION=+
MPQRHPTLMLFRNTKKVERIDLAPTLSDKSKKNLTTTNPYPTKESLHQLMKEKGFIKKSKEEIRIMKEVHYGKQKVEREKKEEEKKKRHEEYKKKKKKSELQKSTTNVEKNTKNNENSKNKQKRKRNQKNKPTIQEDKENNDNVGIDNVNNIIIDYDYTNLNNQSSESNDERSKDENNNNNNNKEHDITKEEAASDKRKSQLFAELDSLMLGRKSAKEENKQRLVEYNRRKRSTHNNHNEL